MKVFRWILSASDHRASAVSNVVRTCASLRAKVRMERCNLKCHAIYALLTPFLTRDELTFGEDRDERSKRPERQHYSGQCRRKH